MRNLFLTMVAVFLLGGVSQIFGDITTAGEVNPASPEDWSSETYAYIASTDVTAVQLMINRFTQRLKLPCVFGGCYEEATHSEY